MSKVTKKLYLETIARIEARNAEPINPIQLTIDKEWGEQLTTDQMTLLNPANFILPAKPIKSDLAEAWETTYHQWSNAWSSGISDAVYYAEFRKVVDIEEKWRFNSDNIPAKSIGYARIELQKGLHQLQEAIDKATALTTELQQLEMAGARADHDDWTVKIARYNWDMESRIQRLESQARTDQQTVEQYEWEQKSKAWNDLHVEALNEDWRRSHSPHLFVTASA